MIPALHELKFEGPTAWSGWRETAHKLSIASYRGEIIFWRFVRSDGTVYGIDCYDEDGRLRRDMFWSEVDAITAQSIIHHLNRTYFIPRTHEEQTNAPSN